MRDRQWIVNSYVKGRLKRTSRYGRGMRSGLGENEGEAYKLAHSPHWEVSSPS